MARKYKAQAVRALLEEGLSTREIRDRMQVAKVQAIVAATQWVAIDVVRVEVVQRKLVVRPVEPGRVLEIPSPVAGVRDLPGFAGGLEGRPVEPTLDPGLDLLRGDRHEVRVIDRLPHRRLHVVGATNDPEVGEIAVERSFSIMSRGIRCRRFEVA